MKPVKFPAPACSKAGLAATLIAGCLAMPAFSQEAVLVPVELTIEDVGASARVDYSGRLRLFSQRVAANSCEFAAEPEDAEHKELLIDAIAQYDRYLAALRDGDDSIGIFGPESSAKILRKMDGVVALWTPIKAAAEAIVKGESVEQNLAFVADHNMELLEAAAILASDINAAYSNPAEMTQANAMVIDIAGRQRMLTQKIAKEACGVEHGIPAFGTVEGLIETTGIFDASLNALINGLPDAGIMPPPTAELAADLQSALADWTVINTNLEAFKSGGEIDDEAADEFFERLETLRETMGLITEQYRDFAAVGG
jgi:hypothetical protein